MTKPDPEIQRQKFMRLYETDERFHDEVNKLLADEVVELRNALSKIAFLRREQFSSGFAYERAVRQSADQALKRLRWPSVGPELPLVEWSGE